ncbi:MAG: mercury(II) reductase [Nitrospirae bacterium]|nr:mercury(II) reductase [Nitrospirota bacterium]
MGLFGSERKSGEFDLVVIGGGSAAFAAGIRASDLGARVALIEKGVIGGTCVNRGCVPSKNLLHAAERYHVYSRDGIPGIPKGDAPADFREVIRQKTELVTEMRKLKYEDLLGAYENITLLKGPAKFVSEHEIDGGGRKIASDRFIIATGASPQILPIPGLDRVGYLTYKEAMELDRLPKSLLVIGGGAIGVELGQVFARFGSKVTILEALDRIVPNEEPEISGELARSLTDEGIEIHTGGRVECVSRDSRSVILRTNTPDGSREFIGEQLLVAAGVVPNSRDLELNRAGIETDKRGGIQVDEMLRTTAKAVWAAGDVTGKMMLVTVSAQQGGVAAENALSGNKKRWDGSTVPHAVFSEPQVAGVGWKEAEARTAGHKIETKLISFEHVPKSAAIRDTRGVLKLIVDAKTYRILGVHIAGPQAAELIHYGTLLVQHKMVVGDILRMTFAYPTFSEVYKIAALSFKRDVTKLSCCAS